MKSLPRRYSREEKETFCIDWQKSGLSQSEYCRQHSLNPMTFNGWIKKFQAKEENGFVQVLVDDKESVQVSTEFLEIVIAGKVTIKLPSTTEETLITKTIREVIKCI